MTYSPDTYFVDIFNGEVLSYAEWLKVGETIPHFDVELQIAKRYLRRVVWKFNRWIYA